MAKAKEWVGCRAQLGGGGGSQLCALSRLRCLSHVCPLLHGALQSLCLLLVYLHVVHLLIGCDGGCGGLWERWDAVSDWEGVGGGASSNPLVGPWGLACVFECGLKCWSPTTPSPASNPPISPPQLNTQRTGPSWDPTGPPIAT